MDPTGQSGLIEKLISEIERGGNITFARFMEAALYRYKRGKKNYRSLS